LGNPDHGFKNEKAKTGQAQKERRIETMSGHFQRRAEEMELEAERVENLDARIEELQARLNTEIAERTREVLRHAVTRCRAEKAEAHAATFKEALTKVEVYLASEYGPLYKLWEDGDICSWDDNPRDVWKDVLGDLRNPKMSTLDIGHGVGWDAVTIYRAAQAALASERKEQTNDSQLT
jgi:hypothetical protein